MRRYNFQMPKMRLPSASDLFFLVIVPSLTSFGVIGLMTGDFPIYLKIFGGFVAASFLFVSVLSIMLRTRMQRSAVGYSDEPEDTHWTPDPIIAYRLSVNALGGEPYEGKPAYCRIGHTHRPPVWDCSCGYYAYSSYPEQDYRSSVLVMDSNGAYHNMVLLCLLWGRVIQCERGYRAEHMTPVVWLHDSDSSIVAVVSAVGSSVGDKLPVLHLSQTARIEDYARKAIENLDTAKYQPYD